jgi:hypothetical protein
MYIAHADSSMVSQAAFSFALSAQAVKGCFRSNPRSAQKYEISAERIGLAQAHTREVCDFKGVLQLLSVQLVTDHQAIEPNALSELQIRRARWSSIDRASYGEV